MLGIHPSNPHWEAPRISAAWTYGNFGTDPKLNPFFIGRMTSAAITNTFFQAVTASAETAQRQMRQDREHHTKASQEREKAAKKPKAKMPFVRPQTKYQAPRLFQQEQSIPNHSPKAMFRPDSCDPRAVMHYIQYLLITAMPV